ncbi:hypothetical protein, partial [Micromonospora aurantiaca (nom. illeg.)]
TDRAGGGAAVGGPDEAAVDELAALLNQAGFAPGSVTPAQAERAARLSQGFGDALRSARSRWGRLLWTVHPGPLRWRR